MVLRLAMNRKTSNVLMTSEWTKKRVAGDQTERSLWMKSFRWKMSKMAVTGRESKLETPEDVKGHSCSGVG
jgi:hypothetical protein